MKRESLKTKDVIENNAIVHNYKPAYSVTKVVITDSDEVYAVNGSECYRINFVEDLKEVIESINGNIGWTSESEIEGLNHFKAVAIKLYEKDYIGLDNEDNAYLLR